MKKISFLLIFLGILVGEKQAQQIILPSEAFKGIPQAKEILVELPSEIDLGIFRRKEKTRLILSPKIKKGWHIYSLVRYAEDGPFPSNLNILESKLIKEAPAYETNPIIENDVFIGLELAKHKNSPKFYQNFIVPDDHELERQSFQANFTYQACSEKICLLPKIKQIKVNYLIEAGPPRESLLISDRQIDENPYLLSGFIDITNKGLWTFLLFAISAGLLALFTPCIFSMIPIVVTFFSSKKSYNTLNSVDAKKNSLFKIILFTAGISVIFTAFGLLSTALWGVQAVISLANNGWLNLSIGILFIVFSLMLMDLLYVPVPAVFNRFFTSQMNTNKKSWFVKTFLMGMAFSVTAFTCTFPFVGTLLIAASYGEWFYPIMGMTVFSVAFTLPFAILAFFPKFLAGFQQIDSRWPKHLKFILGVVELGVAIKFFSSADLIWKWDLISRDIAIGFWIVCLSFLLIYFVYQLKKNEIPRNLFGYSFLPFLIALIFYLQAGFNDKNLGGFLNALLPPPSSGYISGGNFVDVEEMETLIWHSSIEEALTVAKNAHKPLFVDFTGYTCINCRWVEQNIFPRKEVFYTLKNNFILVKLYTDLGELAQINLHTQINRFGSIALPYYVILSAEDLPLNKHAGIFSNIKNFQEFLEDKKLANAESSFYFK